MLRRLGGLLALLLLLPACQLLPGAQSASPPSPESRLPNAPGIRVPDGYRATVFVAEGLAAPTAMAFGPDGRLYVAEFGGRIKAVADTNGDGLGDSVEIWLTDLFSPLGLAWQGNVLYISSQNRLIRVEDLNANGIAEWVNGSGQAEVVEIYKDLGVSEGQHQNNNLVFGPDGKIYVGVGGICNVCEQPNQLTSSILRLEPDGSQPPYVFARGFRNPFGVAFDPTGQLWSTDNGADPPVMENAPDELNLIVEGGFYGYPWFITGDETPARGAIGPVVKLPPHSSANTLLFYSGDHMPELYGQAFIAYYGPDTRKVEDSHKVVRVDLRDPRNPRVIDFATGFDRPLAMTQGPDGRLYVGDFSGGRIYRISRAP